MESIEPVEGEVAVEVEGVSVNGPSRDEVDKNVRVRPREAKGRTCCSRRTASRYDRLNWHDAVEAESESASSLVGRVRASARLGLVDLSWP